MVINGQFSLRGLMATSVVSEECVRFLISLTHLREDTRQAGKTRQGKILIPTHLFYILIKQHTSGVARKLLSGPKIIRDKALRQSSSRHHNHNIPHLAICQLPSVHEVIKIHTSNCNQWTTSLIFISSVWTYCKFSVVPRQTVFPCSFTAETVITALSRGNEYLPVRDIHLEHHYVHFPTSDNDPNAPDRGIKWVGIKGTQLELFLINLPALTLLLLRQVERSGGKKSNWPEDCSWRKDWSRSKKYGQPKMGEMIRLLKQTGWVEYPEKKIKMGWGGKIKWQFWE